MHRKITVTLPERISLARGARLVLTAGPGLPGLTLRAEGVLPRLRAGTYLGREPGERLLQVRGTLHLPPSSGLPDITRPALLVEPLEDADLPAGQLALHASRGGPSLAWVTMSDKGFLGLREDTSGPLIETTFASAVTLSLVAGYILPDEAPAVRALLTDLALAQGFDLVVTTGGTGLAPRDITADVTLSLVEKRLHGFELLMTQAGLAKTPHAAISRAVAGTLGESIILNLPGSPKAVVENLAPLLPALPHALAKLQGDPADCAR